MAGPTTLAASWAAALATLPSDWSDAYVEVEIADRETLDRAALLMAPINPRLDPETAVLRFRAAQTAGYGGSAGMVARCLERCDADGITGEVRMVHAISGSRAVGAQGPTWSIAGRTV